MCGQGRTGSGGRGLISSSKREMQCRRTCRWANLPLMSWCGASGPPDGYGHPPVHLCWPPWPAPHQENHGAHVPETQGRGDVKRCCLWFSQQPRKRTQMEKERRLKSGAAESREVEGSSGKDQGQAEERLWYASPSCPAFPADWSFPAPSFRMGLSSPLLSTSCSSCGSKASFTREPGLQSPTLPLVCVFLTL